MELSFDIYWIILSYSISDTNNLINLRKVSSMFRFIIDKLYIPNKADWENALKSDSIESVQYMKNLRRFDISTHNDLDYIIIHNSTPKKDDIFKFILHVQSRNPTLSTLAEKGSLSQIRMVLERFSIKADEIKQLFTFLNNDNSRGVDKKFLSSIYINIPAYNYNKCSTLINSEMFQCGNYDDIKKFIMLPQVKFDVINPEMVKDSRLYMDLVRSRKLNIHLNPWIIFRVIQIGTIEDVIFVMNIEDTKNLCEDQIIKSAFKSNNLEVMQYIISSDRIGNINQSHLLLYKGEIQKELIDYIVKEKKFDPLANDYYIWKITLENGTLFDIYELLYNRRTIPPMRIIYQYLSKRFDAEGLNILENFKLNKLIDLSLENNSALMFAYKNNNYSMMESLLKTPEVINTLDRSLSEWNSFEKWGLIETVQCMLKPI